MIRPALIVACAASLFAAAASAQRSDPRTEIEAFNVRLADVTRRMDTEALLALWDTAGVSILPNAKANVGKAAITASVRDVMKQIGDAKMQSFDMRCHDIHVSGSLATEWCIEHQVVLLPDKSTFDGWGKMAFVLTLGADGRWRLLQETWVPSAAEP